jgi:hypothetical protein
MSGETIYPDGHPSSPNYRLPPERQSDRIPTFDEMIARRDESIAHNFAEWFFKTWAPAHDIDKARFHADLFTLVYRIYAEAQAPLIKQMSAAMSLSLAGSPMLLMKEAEAIKATVRLKTREKGQPKDDETYWRHERENAYAQGVNDERHRQEEGRAPSDWRRIETAPHKDGGIARCLFGKRQSWGWSSWVGQRDDVDIWLGVQEDGACWDCEIPTHWMPLPEGP